MWPWRKNPKKKIRVSYTVDSNLVEHFRVEAVDDNTQYKSGDVLLQTDIATLCDSSDWQVSIVRADENSES